MSMTMTLGAASTAEALQTIVAVLTTDIQAAEDMTPEEAKALMETLQAAQEAISAAMRNLLLNAADENGHFGHFPKSVNGFAHQCNGPILPSVESPVYHGPLISDHKGDPVEEDGLGEDGPDA